MDPPGTTDIPDSGGAVDTTNPTTLGEHVIESQQRGAKSKTSKMMMQPSERDARPSLLQVRKSASNNQTESKKVIGKERQTDSQLRGLEKNNKSINTVRPFERDDRPSRLTRFKDLSIDENERKTVTNGYNDPPGAELARIVSPEISAIAVAISDPSQNDSYPEIPATAVAVHDPPQDTSTKILGLTKPTFVFLLAGIIVAVVTMAVLLSDKKDTCLINQDLKMGTIPTEIGMCSSKTSLDLSSEGLTGTIPTEIGLLTALTSLDLGYNMMRGTFPTEIGRLTSLSELSLPFVYLSGTIPTEIGLLKSLTSLDLGYNRLNGTIPTEIGNLTSLTSLNLDANYLTGTIPTEIGLLPDLSRFQTQLNFHTGSIPTEFGLLTSLEVLALDWNSLQGTIPAELANSKLLVLSLESNKFTGTIPTELGLLRSLGIMLFENNNLTGTIPTEIGLLESLENFSAGFNNLTGTIPWEMGQCASLEAISFPDNQLQGNASEIFCAGEKKYSKFVADCNGDDPEISCSCCTSCCPSNTAGGECSRPTRPSSE